MKNRAGLVSKYLLKDDWRVKENSNMNFSLQGMNNFISSKVIKDYWLDEIYDDEITMAHNRGEMHIHDLGVLGAYCVGWDLYDLLCRGFNGVAGKTSAAPPKHLDSVLSIAVNFLYTLTGETAGAQAFSHFDTLLAPFVSADNLSYKKVKQLMQGFIFNINIATRVGFQTPFTNLAFDLTPSPVLKNSPVIIGGKQQDTVYGDYQEEMNTINKAFLEVMLEGDSEGRMFTFPIPTYNITDDFDWEHGNMKLLWEATAKYGIPYFSNFINSDMKPEDARSMCCRLRLDNRELTKSGGGLFGADPLTGSIGVVTINMPRLGYTTSSTIEFFAVLSDIMDTAMRSLELKREVLEQLTSEGLYPYCQKYLSSVYEQSKKYWNNHFSTIGLIGMNEACLNLLGEDIGTPAGNELSLRTLDFMRDKLGAYQVSTGNLYNLEATPAEGTAYRLAQHDKNQYPDIIVANNDAYKEQGAAPFYTNSTQLPVDYTNDPLEVLDKQDDLQVKYTGGTVVHLYIGEQIDDPFIVKHFVHTICSHYKLPYFTITPTFSICPTDGYLSGEQYTCPFCDAETEVYSRVVGYLRPVKQWNRGKTAEFAKRQTVLLKGKVSTHVPVEEQKV